MHINKPLQTNYQNLQLSMNEEPQSVFKTSLGKTNVYRTFSSSVNDYLVQSGLQTHQTELHVLFEIALQKTQQTNGFEKANVKLSQTQMYEGQIYL